MAFVVTPIYKSNGNIAFIWKGLWSYPYKKLALDQNTTNTNKRYIQVNTTNDQVISDHILFLKNKFDLELDDEDKKLSNIYCKSKLHKRSSKTRFIITPSQCFGKLFSKAAADASIYL